MKRLWSSMGGKSHLPHRPAVSSSIMAALLAVGVVLGFVATRSSHPNAGSFASTTTTAPTTTMPTVVVPTTAAPTTTAPPTTTTTAAVASASSPCTPSEVRVTTAATAGPSGSDVTITTAVTDVVACSFTPQPGGQLTCPVFIDVTSGNGSQVFPSANQPEGCSPPDAVDLSPGQQESVRVIWPQAPVGSYSANGFWSWSSGAGAPFQGKASASFTVG